MDKIDTQGMSLPIDISNDKGIEVGDEREYKEYMFSRLNVFTNLEREEIKSMIHEVLDEREKRIGREDDSWLYRGTY